MTNNTEVSSGTRLSVVLSQFQREWLRVTFASETKSHAHDPDDQRRAYLVGDAMWESFANAFASYAVDGQTETAEFTVPVLRVVNRYRALCYLAYTGERCPR